MPFEIMQYFPTEKRIKLAICLYIYIRKNVKNILIFK